MATLKLGKQTGSFFNHVMSNNRSTPDPAKGATILHWTDRTAVFVNSVSEDGKRCVIEYPECKRIDGLGMSDHQDYEYLRKENAVTQNLVFRYGSWNIDHGVGSDRPYGRYQKINIAFGYMREYYDFSF